MANRETKATSRRTYHRCRTVATLAAILLSACSGGAGIGSAAAATPPASAPALPLPAHPYFIPGETITWDVSFAGIQGGRARLAIGKIGNDEGRRLIVLRAEAESAGVLSVLDETHDTLSSWIDVDSGLPTRTESSTTGTGKPIVVRSQRVPGVPLAELQIWSAKTGDDGAHKQARLPTMQTHDPLSAVLALRGWAAPQGARVTVYSLGGIRVWKNVFTVEGKDDLDGPLGRRPAIRIHGVSTRVTAALVDDTSKPARTFTFWLTDDAQRIPVRLSAHTELGDIVANATSYTVPD